MNRRLYYTVNKVKLFFLATEDTENTVEKRKENLCGSRCPLWLNIKKLNLRLIYIILLACMMLSCGNSNQSGNQTKNIKTAIRFDDATKTSGVDFTHIPTRTENKWLPEIMGGGVAVVDVNRDGAPDIILTNSGAILTKDEINNAKHHLYINDGKGKFTDQTDAWNLTKAGYGMGIAVGDYDGDGWTDLYFTSYNGNDRLLRNTGKNFEDVTDKAGIKSVGKWGTSAGFFDFDKDGDLDLYVARYVNHTPTNDQKAYRNRVQIYPTPVLYEAQADCLYRNNGNGTFTDISEQAGLTAAPRKGLALAIGDIDLDGDEDVYVANDTEANQLWLNEGNGKFKDVAQLAGCAYSETGKAQAGMGADFSDTDNNGLLDISVTNFQDETTSLYRQIQPLLFREVSDVTGIGQTARARLKFGIDYFDADNDGDEDLLVANGHIEDNIEQNSDSVTFAQINTLYENLGNGNFLDISEICGDALKDKQVSRGLATGDLNGDGLIDYVVANNGGKAQIAFNATQEKGNFIGLWLEGNKNRNATGARVVAKIGSKTIQRQVMGAQSYLSVSDFRVLLGLGQAQTIDELTIYWLGGAPQTTKNLQGGKFYYVREGKDAMTFVPGEMNVETRP